MPPFRQSRATTRRRVAGGYARIDWPEDVYSEPFNDLLCPWDDEGWWC